MASWYPLSSWAPENNVQSCFTCITLKFPAIGCILVAFPHLLVLFSPITDWRMTEKNQFWNHYLREQHKLFFHFTTISHRVIKSRTGDSIHSRSAASKVETRRNHRRRELVPAVFLDHLGFCNQSRRCWIWCIQVVRDIQESTVSHSPCAARLWSASVPMSWRCFLCSSSRACVSAWYHAGSRVWISA